ncbi:AAA family ATPase [Candidatus Woesearchaeota archaeon]|nr:AAA family ATPase [Candidatus Woesearchaeota archaeon]
MAENKELTASLDEQVLLETDDVARIIKSTGIDTASKANVKRAPIKNFYSIIFEDLAHNTVNTTAQHDYVQAFTDTVAVFRTAALEIRKCMDVLTLEQKLGSMIEEKKEAEEQDNPSHEAEALKKQIADAIFFSNRYALYFAGHVGLALLGSDKADVKTSFTFGTKNDASKDRDGLTADLARVATKDILTILSDKKSKHEPVSDDDLKYMLEATFTSWINQFNWRTFEDTAQKYCLDKTRLKFKEYSMISGEFKKKYSMIKLDDRFMKVSKEDVVGSGEFGTTLWNNLVKLGAYDFERKENLYSPASVIFVFGEPGGGKTYTCHAYIRSFAELCKQKGIPLWALTHSTTDYASHYQNKTANELAALAKEINDYQGIVIMYVADADNIFQSRKDPRLTAEQQQTLGVYFKMFDGTLIKKDGRFMAIMDANYIEGIDEATKSRLFDEIIELKRFDKADHFAELAKRSLTKGTSLVVTDPEWLEIGQYLLKSPLSNREIGHVVKKLRREFENLPESMLGKPYEEHLKYRNEQLKNLTKERIVDGFEKYITTRMEIERASYEALRRDDTTRFLQYLESRPQDPNTGAK